MPKSASGPSLSEADVKWLRWLARYRFATIPQLQIHFGIHRSKAYERVARMVAMGLVQKVPWRYGAGTIVVPTLNGMRVAGSDLSTPSVSPGTILHELLVVSLGIVWEANDLTVITDREIRSTLSPTKPIADELLAAADFAGLAPGTRPLFATFRGLPNQAEQLRRLMTSAATGNGEAARRFSDYVKATGGAKKHAVAWHIPDLIVVRPPVNGRAMNVAVEVELHAKQASEWKRILMSYSDPMCGGGRSATPYGGIHSVRYYVPTPQMQTSIQAVASELDMRNMVSVELLSSIDLPGDPLAVAATHSFRADGRRNS